MFEILLLFGKANTFKCLGAREMCVIIDIEEQRPSKNPESRDVSAGSW